MGMLTLAGNVIKRLGTEGPLSTLRLMGARSRALVRSFLEDGRRGVSTALAVKDQEPEIKDARCHWYVATDYETFNLAMDQVLVRPGEDIFVDFGSGKGRMVLLAAERPFRRIIGVEFSAQLHDVALENLRGALPGLKCREVELILADATQWKVPDEATILFFFNPFHGEVLAKVFDNIRRSLAEAPRKITIVYVRSEKYFEKEIAWQEWLTRKVELACLEGKVAIYESKPAATGSVEEQGCGIECLETHMQ